MKAFLKKWMLPLISALILILFVVYWIIKPVDDVIGAFLVTFFLGFPIISILTTIWFCINCNSVYKYFSPILLIPFDFLWLFIFGDPKAIFNDFFLTLGLFSIPMIPAVMTSIICFIVSKVRSKYNKEANKKNEIDENLKK